MKKLENWNYEISISELVSYEYNSRKLNALEWYGVDNWDWYGEAEWDTEEDIIKEFK